MRSRIFLVMSMVIASGQSFAEPLRAATYHVAADGDDAHDGLSPQKAWRSLDRVNAADLKPGDKVLFKRGDQWRGQLLPRSGSEAGPVTYGAYGEGEKPALLGSVARNRPAEWQDEGNNIWSTIEPKTGTKQVLPAKDSPLLLHTEGGAKAALDRDAQRLGGTVRGQNAGQETCQIQLYVCPFPIENGRLYEIRYRAGCTVPFRMAPPRLMQAGKPWKDYASVRPRQPALIGPKSSEFRQFYRANTTAADARLTFYLGGALPDGAALSIEVLAFTECDDTNFLPCDVGNIIFNGGESCGVKRWTRHDLKAQGDYWFDNAQRVVKLYSTARPTEVYREIELALMQHIINESNCSHIVFENLALRYGAAHGIGGGNTRHITVRDCDFSFIGGGDQYGDGRKVRFGNGVEFWGNAHDNVVERCRLWEIYDAALTNQNQGANVRQYNLHYRDNIIWNCEYSFEYWNRPETSVTGRIYFENNTCVNAGHGWGHTQRPDPNGRHLCFYGSPAPHSEFYVRNNIFLEARTNAFYAAGWSPEQIAALDLDHNCWVQAKGIMIKFKDKTYTMAQFAEYQRDTGKETHSVAVDPMLADVSKADFRPRPESPCAGMGAPQLR